MTNTIQCCKKAQTIETSYLKSLGISLLNRTKSLYLKYSKPVIYTLFTMSFTVNTWYIHEKQQSHLPGVSPLALTISNAVLSTAASFFTIKSIKEELDIYRNKKQLLAIAEEINSVAPDKAPLVVILHADGDENGAFEAQQTSFRSLKGSCKVIVDFIANPCEIDSKLESIALNHKIDHVALCGHGTIDSITFRQEPFLGSSLGSLTTSMIHPQLFKQVDPQGVVLLDSCSTGVLNGLAQRISATTGRFVQGPHTDIDAGMEWFILDPQHGLVLLSLDGKLKPVASTYKNGARCASPELDLSNLEKIAKITNDAYLTVYAALLYLERENIHTEIPDY